MLANRGFGRGFGVNRFAGRGFGRPFGGFGRSFGRGFGYGYRGRGFGGCWGCGLGFGLGFGWGWGWPYWGFNWGWPYWDWGFGWGGPGYWGLGWGYPGWGYSYWDNNWGPYAYPYFGNYNGYDDAWVWDNNNAGNFSDYTGGTATNNYSDDAVYSNAPSDNAAAAQSPSESNLTAAVDPESIPTVVYLKDGTSFQITSYWSSGNTLHYVNAQGGESTIDASQIDLQRTVSENAKNGIRFPIKPQPSTATPSAPAVPSTPAAQATLSKAA